MSFCTPCALNNCSYMAVCSSKYMIYRQAVQLSTCLQMVKIERVCSSPVAPFTLFSANNSNGA